MGNLHEISKLRKSNVVLIKKEGYKNCEIESRFGLSKASVSRILCRLIYLFYLCIYPLGYRRKATEVLIERPSNYPDLLPEMPRYCCPLEI